MNRIAVTVICGFLGAGKTTLLNRMVQRDDVGRLAVIVNDFGELNIDAAIIAEVTDAVYSLQNGCICCTVQEDLLAQLVSLSQLSPRLTRIVIECSGVSDPQRILQTLAYPQLRAQLQLDAVLTVVDGVGYSSLEGEFARLSRAQVACADLVLLNKTDLLAPQELALVRSKLGARVPVIETVYAELPDSLLLSDRVEAGSLKMLPAATRHDQLFESWLWQSPQALDPERFRQWLAQIPPQVFRVKGLVHLQGIQAPQWLQHVGQRSQFSAAQNSDAQQAVQLVFIARRGSELRESLGRSLEACLSAA